MKMEVVKCTRNVPMVIAKGVTGGGYVTISGGPVGTTNNPEQWFVFPSGKVFLQEGEEIFGKGGSSAYPLEYSLYNVVYYNNEPSNQTQASPINLTGTIQLNQQ